ncbi:MAG: hypothetical protein JWN46_605 [Acidimicrobiales bacterium]|nr:hypothetical protein [Acidimicrobiales bacterium]
MGVILDDHLLRDVLSGPDRALLRAIGDRPIATTNLWYARLCRAAAAGGHGALLGGWSERGRAAVIEALTALPDTVRIAPMRDLAWDMGLLMAHNQGLSTLGAEAIAAANHLGSDLLVASRDVGPGMRACARRAGVTYRAISR